MEIRVLAKHGMGVREIAREVGMSRNTVRRYLRDEEAVRYKERPRRSAKLDPYRAYIAARLAAAAPETIQANVLLEEIRARGYAGGYTMVKAHVAALRERALPEPVVRFETAPGQQMQVDWAVIRRSGSRVGSRLSVFVATLGWSRAAYVEFVTDERARTLIACHERAFLAFGGRAARGALRQRPHCGDATRRLRAGQAPPPCGLRRLRRTLRVPPPALPALSGADQRQGRAVHPLPAGQLLRALRQPNGAGRARRRRARRQRGRAALAARSGQRAGACHDGRGAGRAAGGRNARRCNPCPHRGAGRSCGAGLRSSPPASRSRRRPSSASSTRCRSTRR